MMTVLSVPSRPSSAAVVRRRIEADLVTAGIAQSIIDNAVIVATELVSNAVRHAKPLPTDDLIVRWEVCTTTEPPVEPGTLSVRITVTDGGGAGQPQTRTSAGTDVNGRGLAIVRALATDWGTQSVPTGEGSVWAVVTR